MDNLMLRAALFYHNEGLCCIPIIDRDKRPAIDWEEYLTRCSTLNEVKEWFGNGHSYNIGIVHGAVSGNYVALDIDHDQGVFTEIKSQFPYLFKGRIEQSGSGEGYHIPLRVEQLPDFGIDSKHDRPRGNRTWKTEKGVVNIRAQFCQTVVPPSIHPTGNRYRFIQKGDLSKLDNLKQVIDWLNELAPPKKGAALPAQRSIRPANGNTLSDAVKDAWGSVIDVFKAFDLVREIVPDKSGDYRLLGNGGLLVKQDLQTWYCFSDEFGGGVFEAWGWCRFGSAYDKKKHFRQVLLEMAQVAGIDVAKFYQRGDEQKTVKPTGDNRYWSSQYADYWERAR